MLVKFKLTKPALIVLTCAFLFSACFLQPANLSIEAKIIYSMGGPQPAARTPFYLLDADPFTLKLDDPPVKAKFDAMKDENEKMAATLGCAVFLLLKEFAAKKKDIDEKISDADAKKYLGSIESARPLWESHLVKQTTTDFEGRARFVDLKAGQYWLLGMTETRRAFALWNIPINLTRGRTRY